MSTIVMKKEALEQLRTTIRLQHEALAAAQKNAGVNKQASANVRAAAATLVDTLVEKGQIPAVSRTNIMEKWAGDHAAVLDAFLSYANEFQAAPPPAMGGADKSASFGGAPSTGTWGEAGDAFEAAMGLR